MNIIFQRDAEKSNALEFVNKLRSLTRHIHWEVECKIDRWDMTFICQGETGVGEQDYFTCVFPVPVHDNKTEMLPYFAIDYFIRQLSDRYKVESYDEQRNSDYDGEYI